VSCATLPVQAIYANIDIKAVTHEGTLLTLHTALLLCTLKQILQQMWAADLVPNDIVYNSAIDAMAKGGKPDQARELSTATTALLQPVVRPRMLKVRSSCLQK
jgi:hypothetical protein